MDAPSIGFLDVFLVVDLKNLASGNGKGLRGMVFWMLGRLLVLGNLILMVFFGWFFRGCLKVCFGCCWRVLDCFRWFWGMIMLVCSRGFAKVFWCIFSGFLGVL